MRGLDAWITGGRYSKELLNVKCPECEEVTTVLAETEYGATEWTPSECKTCGETFPDDAESESAEPPERERDDGDDGRDVW